MVKTIFDANTGHLSVPHGGGRVTELVRASSWQNLEPPRQVFPHGFRTRRCRDEPKRP